ncbi:HWE histidine kinase domain-containing protein [Jannaschia ovalis]|uniref:histidine kinase n=1 Tax=Jannaschia ovalis TaxID=3038773 RepID=A0ABY8LHG9_9RHOB|nr:HWE histidine kinase domain-containing protein [Jannaschia sp. GRR-S6-38]WGH79543.1 GAF domain-containing protein [Jannaschia sp. GRR-S6-38]
MPSASHQPSTDGVDLTTCDREPIHVIGRVQAFGCLLSVTADWLVNHASANLEDFLGKEAEAVIGTRFSELFSAGVAHMLRGKTQTLGGGTSVARVFGYRLFDNERRFDIAVHQTARGFTYEFERTADGHGHGDMQLVQPLVARLRDHAEIGPLCDEAARAMRALTGFDRVMIYQFAPDGTGTVVSEACDGEGERYLGLRYPASDIPRQARKLYEHSRLRLIADVDGPEAPVLPGLSPEGEPLDLSLSICRAVSPTHLQYLRNMGVAASMSVSILRGGELWGLFACHHRTPHYVDYETRSAVELFAQLFTYELSERLHRNDRAEETAARSLHDRVMSRISDGCSLMEDVQGLADEIWDVIPFDGMVIWSDGRFVTLGAAPNETEFQPLVRFLNTAAVNSVYATDNLSARYPQAEMIADRVAGILALPISRHPRDYIVLFRPELAQIVRWAGNPEKPVETCADGSRILSPRKSFEAWREVVKGRSAPWTRSELNAAGALRLTLLEVVLKVTDEAGRAQARAQQKQELLVAELNHRVRNILNLISGIVSQGHREGISLSEFTAELDGRIQSLARAHDQLTKEDWAPAPLRRLIEVEAAACPGDGRARIAIGGEDVLLMPEAFTTLALVLHELVTNSVKYGALSNGDGQVAVRFAREADGALRLDWRERGGPAVRAPDRQGFGTTIIERSIPFELQGRAQLDYAVTGVEASFHIPGRFWREAPRPSGSEPAATTTTAPDAQPLAGKVLLVEDNLVIAMDACDKLKKLGAETIHVTNSVAGAMEKLGAGGIDFAVLDVNLGTETSEPVAHALAARGIPFVLVTGYGEQGQIRKTYPPSPILQKPYVLGGLRSAIADLLERTPGDAKRA